MEFLNRDLDSIWTGVEESLDDFLLGLSQEEIKPVHVEEVGLSVVAILFMAFTLTNVSPMITSAQASYGAQPAAVMVAMTATTATNTVPSGLTQEQVEAILSLLRSFNANDSVVVNVKAALLGKRPEMTQEQARFCHAFAQNLRVGDKGTDVAALQKALKEEGMKVADSEGSFGESTASAVVELQEKYKDDILTPNRLVRGSGYVGASTRTKLNMLYRCGEGVRPGETPSGTMPAVPATPTESSATPATPGVKQPLITVLSPNGGENYLSTGSIGVSWSISNAVGPVRIHLSSYPNNVDYYASGNFSGGTGKDGTTLSGEALNIPSGQYRIRVCDEGVKGAVCDESNTPFTVTSSTNN